jgi:hypothetical protein
MKNFCRYIRSIVCCRGSIHSVFDRNVHESILVPLLVQCDNIKSSNCAVEVLQEQDPPQEKMPIAEVFYVNPITEVLEEAIPILMEETIPRETTARGGRTFRRLRKILQNLPSKLRNLLNKLLKINHYVLNSIELLLEFYRDVEHISLVSHFIKEGGVFLALIMYTFCPPSLILLAFAILIAVIGTVAFVIVMPFNIAYLLISI